MRMMDVYADYAAHAEKNASKLGLATVPWRDVLDCIEYMLRSMAEDEAFIESERSAGRSGGLRQFIRIGFGDIWLNIDHGLEHGEWPQKKVAGVNGPT